MLSAVVIFVRLYDGVLVYQLFALIVAVYLNIFPALNYLLSEGVGFEAFFILQLLIGGFFQIPLFVLMRVAQMKSQKQPISISYVSPQKQISLSPALPFAFVVLLVGFWYVAIYYDLFFRRIGHAELQLATSKVPLWLLYVYRCVVEMTFFTVLFLSAVIRGIKSSAKYYKLYVASLVLYLVSFVLFFFENSRMHLILLLIVMLCSGVGFRFISKGRLNVFLLSLLMTVLVIGITLLRELVIEDNNRIDTENLWYLLKSTGELIATRLDALLILYRLAGTEFNPLGFDLSGVEHVLKLYSTFFIDQASYNSIKSTLVTSPSVVIVNRYLPTAEVDFPKAMILDMFLTFGILGLVMTALLLSLLIAWVEKHANQLNSFSAAFLISIYILPLIFQFEKELIGFLIAIMKWSPMLALVYVFRPREVSALKRV